MHLSVERKCGGALFSFFCLMKFVRVGIKIILVPKDNLVMQNGLDVVLQTLQPLTIAFVMQK